MSLITAKLKPLCHVCLPLTVVAFSVFSLWPVPAAQADGKPALENATGSEERARPTTRQNDPRLPPVLPGEEIVTESGQRMRVWSSSGPVPVMPRSTPQQLPSGLGGVNGGGVGVIVDARPPHGGVHGDHGNAPRPGLRNP